MGRSSHSVSLSLLRSIGSNISGTAVDRLSKYAFFFKRRLAERARNARASTLIHFRLHSLISCGFYFRSRTRRSFEKI